MRWNLDEPGLWSVQGDLEIFVIIVQKKSSKLENEGVGGWYSVPEFSEYFEILNLQRVLLTATPNFQSQNEKHIAANQNSFFNKWSM